MEEDSQPKTSQGVGKTRFNIMLERLLATLFIVVVACYYVVVFNIRRLIG